MSGKPSAYSVSQYEVSSSSPTTALLLLILIEMEYASNRGTKIVPVLLQPHYKADGWLGLLLGTKLYYDLTKKISTIKS